MPGWIGVFVEDAHNHDFIDLDTVIDDVVFHPELTKFEGCVIVDRTDVRVGKETIECLMD
jgi:hypothetical protein